MLCRCEALLQLLPQACLSEHPCARLGLQVGLGTDVAGGYDSSMLGAQRAAVVASLALHAQRIAAAPDPAQLALRYQAEGDADVLSWKDALWLATVGGAQALGLVRAVQSGAAVRAGKVCCASLPLARLSRAHHLAAQHSASCCLELDPHSHTLTLDALPAGGRRHAGSGLPI
jgi:hypothetical protein